MLNRFKPSAVVAAVMLVTAACGGGEGEAVEDPAQNIADNITSAEGVASDLAASPAGADTADPVLEEALTELVDELEADFAASAPGGYLAGGFLYPFDPATLDRPGSGVVAPSEGGYEGLTTVTISQGDDVVFVWQSRGANDGGGRYSCQLSVHEGGMSQLAFEVVTDGDETYYWDPTLADPELRPNDSPEIDEATWLCPAKPGFFDDVPEFFALGDIVDSSQDAATDGSTNGFHVTSRMDAVDAGLGANDYEGEVLVTADATRSKADVEVRWPPMTGTLEEITVEDSA